jgi:hypothetical protein
MTIKLGSKGPEVTAWQRIIGIEPADGDFGPITDALTKNWQSKHGIEPDGVVGILTWGKANELSKPQYPAAPANFPKPEGVRAMKNPVSKDVTNWSIKLLNDAKNYPMGSVTTEEFDGRTITARIEWHTWTHRAGKLVTGIFRGVTLYESV